MLEELCDGKEDSGRRALPLCGVSSMQKYAGIQWARPTEFGPEMGFGDELLTEANPIVTVDAAGIQQAVFFNIVSSLLRMSI